MDQAVLVKLDSLGQRIWATYFGGTGLDLYHDVGCDAEGNIYAAGAAVVIPGHRHSSETCIPAKVNSANDGFYMKMDSSGALIFSSYLGGFITRIRHDGYIPVTLSRIAAQRVHGGVRAGLAQRRARSTRMAISSSAGMSTVRLPQTQSWS
jgi:hypothetical protein